MLDRSEGATQEQIKLAARRLLVLHGYSGLRLADIATELDITRANVHYHFGSKQALVEEVICDYMEELIRRYEVIWRGVDTSYADKVRATIEFNRWRFKQFHDGMLAGNKPWSLIDRMRNDVTLLSERSRIELSRLNIVEDYVLEAVNMAQKTGEIGGEASPFRIAQQLGVIISCASTITQYRGEFNALEDIYLGHLNFAGIEEINFG